MPLILGANSLTGGYEVDNSLRFNSGSSDSLTRTLSTTSNRQIFTWSSWVKRDKLNTGTDQFLFSSSNYNTGSNTFTLNIILKSSGSDQLAVGLENSVSGTDALRQTTQVFRDISAWYHIVAAIDTTQATASNRIKVYVNGSEVTSFANNTNPTQNANVDINQSGQTPYVGAFLLNSTPQRFFSGYLAETYFIDGQALTPSSFGQTDSATGIWQPKAYTGSFGTNGFYLEFKDSSALGDDTSGNGNDFTANNLTSIDQTTDTPTNNFATFNSIKFTGGDLTQGNLELDSTSGSWKTRNSTIGVSTGKWYMEFKMGSISADESGVAIVPDTVPDGNFPASDATRSPAIAYNSDGRKLVNGSATSAYFSAMSTDDIIGIALDMDNETVQFYRNGSTTGSPIDLSDAFTSSNYPLFFVAAVFNTRDVQANFGNPSFTISSGNADANGYGNFEYAVPSGYFALCTKNLADYG
jgi:hypothetical protein